VLHKGEVVLSKLTPTEAKFYQYFQEHKTPVTIETLAKRYIMSTSRVSAVLRGLSHWGLIETTQVGSRKFFKLKNARSEDE
jgi:DNA-binding transcriptional regulator GbsR (MarR family)